MTARDFDITVSLTTTRDYAEVRAKFVALALALADPDTADAVTVDVGVVEVDDDDVLVAKRAGTIEPLATVEDVHRAALRSKNRLYCSSSVDFPEEHTTSAEVIALCRAIRA